MKVFKTIINFVAIFFLYFGLMLTGTYLLRPHSFSEKENIYQPKGPGPLSSWVHKHHWREADGCSTSMTVIGKCE